MLLPTLAILALYFFLFFGTYDNQLQVTIHNWFLLYMNLPNERTALVEAIRAMRIQGGNPST